MKRKKKNIDPLSYSERSYRQTVDPQGLLSCDVKVQETDLHILATIDVRNKARDLVIGYRNQLENYITNHPDFLTSLRPLPADPLAPKIIRQMLTAGLSADVGPMAAVAGALAEFVGRDLLADGVDEISVENGGDIFLSRSRECVISIFAGQSPLSNRVGLKIDPGLMPLGICTSSGTIGHSLSFGKADAVTVLSSSTLLADAVATRLGNEVNTHQDISQALEIGRGIEGVAGVLIIVGDKLGAIGNIELVKL